MRAFRSLVFLFAVALISVGSAEAASRVFVIHGIGNQSPMETLRGQVDAVWSKDPRLVRHGTPRTWSKSERCPGSQDVTPLHVSPKASWTRSWT